MLMKFEISYTCPIAIGTVLLYKTVDDSMETKIKPQWPPRVTLNAKESDEWMLGYLAESQWIVGSTSDSMQMPQERKEASQTYEKDTELDESNQTKERTREPEVRKSTQ